jgi:catalase
MPKTSPLPDLSRALSSNQGTLLSDNQNSLRAGPRGPTLLEDFLLREKITHFDHERIPERIVHARGSAAHGYFECLQDCSEWTRANFLRKAGQRTPVFARLSTVAGGAGSADTVRDVRGFAVKFYTQEGNFDLVGNNLPVFFIQDAMKFPDLAHAVKMEPDRGFPQAASAHDTFWDFVSLVPESLHMVMWAMSMRTLPRSLRMMDGFGVHTFRFVNASDEVKWVKFHWRAELGLECLTWDEAVKIAGADADYHRRDLWEAIARGDAPSWLLAVQVFDEQQAAQLPFDVLDPTKLIPEELVPLQTIGRMVLDRNPDNFFAETEQVAFCPAHLVPGIDFSEDPLLQGRLFSYTDTQLSRLGSANFHQLPVNQARCPVRNFQRDGQMQFQVPTGRVAYEPQSLDTTAPRTLAQQGFRSVEAVVDGTKLRARAESFSDHLSQARQFFRSQTTAEQLHISRAFAFELGRLEFRSIRQRVLGHLALIDSALLSSVAERLGVELDAVVPAQGHAPVQDLPVHASLSALASRNPTLKGRSIGILVADGADPGLLSALQRLVRDKGGHPVLVASSRAGPRMKGGDMPEADIALDAAPSCLFDHVVVLGGTQGIARMAQMPAALAWLRDAWRHLKAIGLDSAAAQLAQASGIGHDAGIVPLGQRRTLEAFCKRASQGKVFERDGAPGTDA